MRGNRVSCDEVRHAIVFSLPMLLILVGVSATQNTVNAQSLSANDLARRVVDNELKTEQQDQSHWNFHLKTHTPNGASEVDEVVETSDGDLKLPVQINGHKLTPGQKQKAEKRIQRLVRDPGELRKAREQEDQDASQSQQLLKMLPDAFNFSYGQRRGNLVELNFSPNPKFRPSSHEQEVFHAMKGSLWVDSKQNRLEEIIGHLTHEVKFAGGLLGHLDRGGTFDVKQANVAPGYWELTQLKVQMKGKALFFKTISVQQNDARTDYKLVPQDLSLAQAAQMLLHRSAASQP